MHRILHDLKIALDQSQLLTHIKMCYIRIDMAVAVSCHTRGNMHKGFFSDLRKQTLTNQIHQHLSVMLECMLLQPLCKRKPALVWVHYRSPQIRSTDTSVACYDTCCCSRCVRGNMHLCGCRPLAYHVLT